MIRHGLRSLFLCSLVLFFSYAPFHSAGKGEQEEIPTIKLSNLSYDQLHIDELDLWLSAGAFAGDRLQVDTITARGVQTPFGHFEEITGTCSINLSNFTGVVDITIVDKAHIEFHLAQSENNHIIQATLTKLSPSSETHDHLEMKINLKSEDVQAFLHDPLSVPSQIEVDVHSDELTAVAELAISGHELELGHLLVNHQGTLVSAKGTMDQQGSFSLDTTYGPYQAKFEGEFFRKTLQILLFELETPEQKIKAAHPIEVTLGESGALDIHYGTISTSITPVDKGYRIAGSANIHEFLQYVMKDTLVIIGMLDFDFTLTGDLANPSLSGQGIIQNGTYENIETGAIFKHINLTLKGGGDKLLLTDFIGYDPDGGTLVATGQMDPSLHYTIELTIQRALLANTDFIQAVGSGTLQFDGDFSEASLKGTLHADGIGLMLDSENSDLIEPLDVVFVHTPDNFAPPKQLPKPQDAFPIHLDIRIEIPGTMVIQGDHLESHWEGTLHASGTDDIPILGGDLHIISGTYDFNGKEFQISQGMITFTGDLQKKPSLYVIAGRDLGEIIAEVIVRGALNNPELTFRSNPPLSQHDIVSWILFGHGTSENTPYQRGQLNQTIKNLTSNSSSSPDLISQVKNTLGIDRIDFKRSMDEENAVSVQFGKYIFNGVYVCINKSLSNDANRLAIEANLFSNVKLQAEVGDDYQAELLLKWKKDY